MGLFTKKEKETYVEWLLLVILFLMFWAVLIFKNCIWVWPPFHNFKACVQEQKMPAAQKAAEFPSPN